MDHGGHGRDLVAAEVIAMREFDQAKRERVRLALIDYIQGQRIGVPTLANRIREANPRRPKIAIKTLQRFLAGQGRTFDMYVSFYETFVAGQNEREAVSDLGQGLRNFFGGASQDLAGTYVEDDPFPSRFEIVADQNFWRVTAKIDRSQGYRLLKGVMVEASSTAFAVLKDALTGLPFSYVFVPEGDRLIGNALKPNFSKGTTGGYSYAITLIKETGRAAA